MATKASIGKPQYVSDIVHQDQKDSELCPEESNLIGNWTQGQHFELRLTR